MDDAERATPSVGEDARDAGRVVASQDDRQPALLENGLDDRPRVTRVLLVPPGDGPDVAAIDDADTAAGEQVAAEVEVVVGRPAREPL